MSLVSLLILPAVINLQDNDPARYAIAGAALVVLGLAVAFSKRKAAAMDEGPGGSVHEGVSNKKAALQTDIDRWIHDLGEEEPDLQERLREVKGRIEAST